MHLNHRILLLALLLAGIAGAIQAQEEPATVPDPLPVADFQLADFQGRIVLVDFWASWCEPCRHSLPWLNTMQQKYGEQGLQVVMVNLDRDAEAAAKMATDIGGGIKQFLDPAGELAARYDLEGMPSSFVYDQSGRLVKEQVGFLSSECEANEAHLLELLRKKEKETDVEEE